MDLTILIPTKNRHNHIKKLLKYYKYYNFTGKIFIFDISLEEIMIDPKKNSQDICEYLKINIPIANKTMPPQMIIIS